MTWKNEVTEREVEEHLAHPMDPLMVDAYRSILPNRTAESTRQAARSAAQETESSGDRDMVSDPGLEELKQRYQALVSGECEMPVAGLRLQRRLGQGGQGIVFLARKAGADEFTNEHLAIKLFSPHKYPSVESYENDMRRIARVASVIAGIDQGNVLDVYRFEASGGIRIMVMKRIKGYDLRELMTPSMLECVKNRDLALWTELTQVVAGPGSQHTRFTPGAAVAVIRACLEALDRLHSRGIVHGDVRPSNIMISPEGEVKLVDTGSALEWRRSRRPRFFTPRYAALEVLEQDECTPSSDLASLGYVLVELLTGCAAFPDRELENPHETYMPQESSTGIHPYRDPELAEEKRQLPGRLERLLGHHSSILHQLCRKLIDPDPQRRFENARFAELYAYKFVQQLERAGLACHFRHEFRRWMESLQTDSDR